MSPSLIQATASMSSPTAVAAKSWFITSKERLTTSVAMNCSGKFAAGVWLGTAVGQYVAPSPPSGRTGGLERSGSVCRVAVGRMAMPSPLQSGGAGSPGAAQAASRMTAVREIIAEGIFIRLRLFRFRAVDGR